MNYGKKDIAIVILNYNGQSFLEKFLPFVIEHSQGAQIIVADNQSSDESVVFMKQNYPTIQCIINDSNGGFAKGYNDALKHINSPLYLLLNSDIEVTENWLDPLLAHMNQNESVVACQPKVLAYQDKTKFEHAGAAGGYLDALCYPFCRGRVLMTCESDQSQYEDDQEIFWATGACMLIRSKNYWEMNGFDEDFFAHMEEIDLCWRLKNQGHSISYVTGTKVYHVGGGTLSYLTPFKTYLNFRNSLFMITKNYQNGSWVLAIFKRLLLDGLAGMRFLLSGEGKHLIAILKAHFHYYGKMSKMLAKRKQISVSSPNMKGCYKGSIIWEYFVKGVQTFSNLNSKKFQ